MNYEAKLASMLGSLPSTKMEKIASELEEMTVEELDALTAQDGPSFLDEASSELDSRESILLADEWGRELAHAHFEKLSALPAASFLGKGLGMAGRAAQGFSSMGSGARMATGAVAGGLAGAASGGGVDPQTGQQRGRLGRALVGAAGGAALGKAAPRITSAVGARSANFRAGQMAGHTGIHEGLDMMRQSGHGVPSGVQGMGARSSNLMTRTEGGVAARAAGKPPAAPGGAPAQSPGLTPEQRGKMDKLTAEMQNKRTQATQLGEGGLSQSEIAARQAHNKGTTTALNQSPSAEVTRTNQQAAEATAAGRSRLDRWRGKQPSPQQQGVIAL